MPATAVPAAFTFCTTNPATNQVTGTTDTPVDIPAGGLQTYVFGFMPGAPYGPADTALQFTCANTYDSAVIAGLDTLLFSTSSKPVPDIVALGATISGDGILTIPGNSRSGAFAVASVNVGVAASITVKANTGSVSLPLTLSLCQTNPGSGQCSSAIGTSVTTTIGANATPTFGIFAQAAGAVPFVPQSNRVFVEFADQSGVVRGSTSVAVRTQ